LDCFKTVKIDLKEEIILKKDYKMLLNKAIALIAFFTILRSSEMVNLNRQNIKEETDGVLLCTNIKTVNDQLVNVFIPKIKDTRIC
jgi:integrase